MCGWDNRAAMPISRRKRSARLARCSGVAGGALGFLGVTRSSASVACGATQLTRMPYCATSFDKEVVSAITPPLDAA